MLNNSTKNLFRFCVVALSLFLASCAGTQQLNSGNTSANTAATAFGIDLDTVKAQKFDTGKMWTFDNPPVDYFKQAYGFNPSPEWFDKARKSALRFASYCSASFVSEDGLVMTNHHCGRESVTEVNKEGEDLHKTGFWAPTLADERPVPGLFVDQLVLIKDVTKEVQNAINSGKTDEEKVNNKNAKIKEIEARTKKETGLKTSVVTLYNGGEYSLYGYKTYNDVRLVFAPENQAGFFGGDYDNFTYPRYNLDCTFFRVYDENGKPLKTDNYYKWSQKGAAEGDPIFVVGNPGRTNRLNTVAQLEYSRDISYPMTLNMLNTLVDIYSQILKEHPEKEAQYEDKLFGFSNSQKVYVGLIKGLNDPVLMARKKDFEKNFRAAVDAKPELKAKYGAIWAAIEQSRNEARNYSKQIRAYSLTPYTIPAYLAIAREIINFAKIGAIDDSARTKLFPKSFDKDMADKLLKAFADNMVNVLGKNDEMVQKVFGGKSGNEAVQYALSHSALTTREGVMEFSKKDPKEILASNDPFIYYIVHTSDMMNDIRAKLKDIQTKEDVNVQLLGQALFEVYGTSIPPDATFTLRIADGVVKGYDYNGTKAPAKVTFYGLYDRYFSFNKQAPWDLPERWKNPPADFNLETPMCFVSTNDIIGGNSGSPVINKNLEIVGLAFDGNIESLPGQFIYTTEQNRCLSVDSEGMVEAIKDLYKAKRLSDELREGKIPDGYKASNAQENEKKSN
ncbi:MAG: S46 family peptidase [Bacteroidota bacterium]|nr:S46 family peptidase [Bacteroidota bacterium]MDP4190199.1 S46 family peptidase [Bacteroidota bacterium]MDP4193798.1 S46 family peptidase [Bacteroidota bacterium]